MTPTIAAIDPGPVRSAWLLYAPTGKIGDRGIDNNDTVLTQLCRGAKGTLRHLVVEMVESFGMPVGREVFETVYWLGRFCEAWAYSASAEQITRLYRRDVKLHLCQSARAKDSNVRQALLDRFGPPGTKKEPGFTYGIAKDLWSALALAVTFADRERTDRHGWDISPAGSA
jgi:hypothetical protein